MSERRELNMRLAKTNEMFSKKNDDYVPDQQSQTSKSTTGSSQQKKENPHDEEADNWQQEHENFQNELHQNQTDDMLSINSFNSSMNFAKLQNSINSRTTVLSESTTYYKSKLQKF